MSRAEPTGVAVIVPLLDEVARLPAFLEMVRGQTLRPDVVVVADGMSTDGSRQLLADAAREWPGLLVVDNPRRIVPAALNVALSYVDAPLVARMDTHADYDADYLRIVARTLTEHSEVSGVGGSMGTEGRGPWGRAIAATLRRRFGLGGARHRVEGPAGPIPHVFSGCYRTEVLRRIGGWDERLAANEDFEADIRIWKSGGQLWLVPEARSTWYVRESPRRLASQMWRYGYYKALTLRLHPGSLQLRQLAPPAVVLGLVGAFVVRPRWGIALTTAYGGVAGALGAAAARCDGASAVRGAAVPPIVHLSWGAGLLAGLCRCAGVRRAVAGHVMAEETR